MVGIGVDGIGLALPPVDAVEVGVEHRGAPLEAGEEGAVRPVQALGIARGALVVAVFDDALQCGRLGERQVAAGDEIGEQQQRERAQRRRREERRRMWRRWQRG